MQDVRTKQSGQDKVIMTMHEYVHKFTGSSITTIFQVLGEHTVKLLANKIQEMKREDMKK